MSGGDLSGVLIGAGYFAQFHAQAWQRTRGAKLTAVVDSTPGKAREFADRHGIERAYESLEEAFDRRRPAFVDITTRPEAHLELTRAAAARGCHVISQKPMAPTWDECVAMCEACEAAGVRLMIHENWRWQPWFREVRRLIDAGTLGKILQVSFFWRTGDGRGEQPYPTQPYFSQMPRLLVYETLVHILDTYRYLQGEIASVYCRNRRNNPHIIGEDQSLIELQFAAGPLGLIDGNRVTGPFPSPVAMGSLIVEGEQATLRMSPDGRLFLTPWNQPEQPLPFEPPTTGYKGDSVLATQQHLIDSLHAGTPSESDGRDYLKTVALVEACYQSAAEGRAVEPNC